MFRGVNQLEKNFEGAIDETRQRGHGRLSKREAIRMILRFSTCTTEEMEGFSFLSLSFFFFFLKNLFFFSPIKNQELPFFCFGQINLGIAANHSRRILKYQLDNLNWCLGKAQDRDQVFANCYMDPKQSYENKEDQPDMLED